MEALHHKAKYRTNKLHKRLRRLVGQAIEDYRMIGPGDRVMVCLSGGKDSYTLLDILLHLQRHAPVDFDIIAVHLDQKQPGYPGHVLPEYLDDVGVEYRIAEQDTYRVVQRVIPEGKTTCSLCSRLRRGALYRLATEVGATRIALGHHREDILETFFLNLFHGGTLSAMPAKLRNDTGDHVVIRPLAYCREQDIARYAAEQDFPIIDCNLCGSQSRLQRQVIKEMMRCWDHEYPGRLESMFRALQQVRPSQLLDQALFPFAELEQTLPSE